ncbi:uncharacterized protein LTHEOB_6018 [Lasiodiplodia theobromae]|uniref:uncharacterized protein n=1 Tax=Lasiodiplodia theobromae TaxID=45133 RepID=UPI0015C38234|nr:uncharacterized protein LTHEOB_6018 [Lasiodiplodia theobromae]KAF4544448.1 hypothetical protein LTHEOB_6018 [Lasiodiplodia theobromae]
MDPLTAVGLASNILQFVDFARSIVSDAKKFYDTTSGAKDEYQEATHGGNLSEEEKELKELGEQSSSHKDWIKSLQTRLDRISQQFTGERLLTQLKHTETTLKEIAAENRRLASRSEEDIHHLQEQLQHVIMMLERGERQRDAAISLAGIAETGAQFSAEQFILGRLFFHGMNERHTNVHVEHEKTLSWIFDEDSPEGLLQSILYQLVAAIPLLCAHLSDVDIKIYDVIRLIEALKASADLKACVSSRPWNAFERAFGQDQANKLYMQDLTKSDIRKYVRDTLEDDETFQELMESEGEASSMELVHDIVDAAQGVFLWVILVVRSLLEGLTNSDNFKKLQQRLRDLPKDLNEYFERILFSDDNFYNDQASAMCLVTLIAARPLPLMSYCYSLSVHDFKP